MGLLHRTNKLTVLTVMALPWSLWFFNLCRALYASCRRFIHINAQPLGGIKSMDTMSPYSPNVSDSSSWCTSFDRCPTQRVVLHTERCSYIITGSLMAKMITVVCQAVNYTGQEQPKYILKLPWRKNSIKSSQDDGCIRWFKAWLCLHCQGPDMVQHPVWTPGMTLRPERLYWLEKYPDTIMVAGYCLGGNMFNC